MGVVYKLQAAPCMGPLHAPTAAEDSITVGEQGVERSKAVKSQACEQFDRLTAHG